MPESQMTPPESTPPAAAAYRLPAEWEPHRGTWLAWPHRRSDWPGRFAPIGSQQRQMRLYQHDDALVIDLPSASEAVVPQHSQPWPPPGRDAP